MLNRSEIVGSAVDITVASIADSRPVIDREAKTLHDSMS
jgi:hypothetical protein